MDSSSIVVILACGRFKGKSEATKSELSKDFSISLPCSYLSVSSYPDKVRGAISNSSLFMLRCSFRYEPGVLNEGGLFGERQGWHLPSYPTSSWVSRSLSEGLPNNVAGVGFFVTTFKLNIPRGLDVMMSFTFQEPFGQPYRAFLFVNGWMMGKRVGNLGLVINLFARILDGCKRFFFFVQTSIKVPCPTRNTQL